MVVVFDACQRHAVIEPASSGFNLADFPHDRDCTQVFLSWELPIENFNVGQLLRVELDINPSHWLLPPDEQVWRNGAKAALCAESGRCN